MTSITRCAQIAQQMTTFGKGILAADESIATMSSRLEKAGVAASAQSRRDYRELLSAAPGLAEGVSGIIFCDETLNQTFADDTPFPEAVRGTRNPARHQGRHRREALPRTAG